MEVVLSQFVKSLAASGLMSADEVSAFLDSLPDDEQPDDGAALAKELVRQKKLTRFQARAVYQGKTKLVLGDYVIQAARGPAYAHGEEVIHRDIKPSNLLLNGKGTVKVLDMGLARLNEAIGSHDETAEETLTGTGQAMGTIDYMPPEQAENTKTVDERADVYSLGCTLFYLLTGRATYHGDTTVNKLLAHREAPIPSLRAERPDVPEKLDAVFQKMVGKRPQDRQASMVEVIAELERCVATGQEGVATTESFDAGIIQTVSPDHETLGKQEESLPSDFPVVAPSDDLAHRHTARPLNPRVIWGAVGGVASFLFLVLLFGVILKMRTPDGTLVVEIDPPDAVVQVLDSEGTIEIERKDEKGKLSISVDPGKHRLKVEKDGFEVFAKDFEIRSGGEKVIPPGEFVMGSSAEERARFLEEATAANDSRSMERIPAEGPRHRVRITRPFRLGRHEVTRGQFRRFVDKNGYKTDAEKDGKGGYGLVDGQWAQDPRFVWSADLGFEQTDEHPVVNVSWNDAVAFCGWLSEKEGGTYALPSEAQWEYACRAGTTTLWHCGESETTLEEYGWFNRNSGSKTHAAGELKPNGWGLYDMHGNAWEWCADWWGTDYYAQSVSNDPSGPPTGSGRVIRGGCWHGRAGYCRSAGRHDRSPATNEDGSSTDTDGNRPIRSGSWRRRRA